MAETSAERRFHPLIYVRGFAGTENEIEQTVADPYMGFNLGATKFKQGYEGRVRRHYFESPLVRLRKDFEYEDVYSDGLYMPIGRDLPARPVIIYRYYDEQFFDELDEDEDGLPPIRPHEPEAAPDEVSGHRRSIEDFAAGLAKLVLKVRSRYLASEKVPAEWKEDFKVHLVGHSMGGLIIRSFLQYVGSGGQRVQQRYTRSWEKRFREAKECIDKVFTYATPHNGIELEIVGNVPSFFSPLDANHFNRRRMASYLDLPKWTVEKDAVNNLYGQFPVEKIFTLIGTNHQDYAVMYGWSRRLVGPMSDGLVRVKNASVLSQKSRQAKLEHAPRAFVHRSHSGHFGIVNSEEGYQNLTRFLFGDVRVDCVMEVDQVTLPSPVQEKKEAGSEVRASYHIECEVAVRGLPGMIHRRVVREGSAIFREYDELVGHDQVKQRNPHLFSLFLRSDARVNEDDPSLGFALTVSVKVPEYVVDRRLWFDSHYEGGDLFSQRIHLAATPPDPQAEPPQKEWTVQYGFPETEQQLGVPDQIATLKKKQGIYHFEIPLDSTHKRPGLKGRLHFTARPHA